MPDTGFDTIFAVGEPRRGDRGSRARRAQVVGAGLLPATSLLYVATATMIRTEPAVVTPADAALVGAGIISVLAFPPVTLSLVRRRAQPVTPGQPPPSPSPPPPATRALTPA
jgi:hypothetical protein